MSILNSISIEAKSSTPKQLFVLCHGRFNNKSGMVRTAHRLGFRLPDAKFVLPDAPYISDPSNPLVARQWFDIQPEDPSDVFQRRAVNMQEVEASALLLNELVDRERDALGLTDADVFMGGFSQGAIISLQAGLSRPAPVGGILGWSGMLVHESKPAQWAKPPVYLYHGDQDTALRIHCYHEAMAKLQAVGIQVTGTLLPGIGHSIERQGIDDGAAFIKNILNSRNPQPVMAARGPSGP
jgi:phospholipase/carboxylesterase